MDTDSTLRRIAIRELVKYYLRLGLLGFGGPVALVGQMERELVGDKKWLTKDEMREGIAVCHSSPSSRLPGVLGRCSASCSRSFWKPALFRGLNRAVRVQP